MFSQVQKERNKIESHFEIAVIDDTSDADKCDISNVDKLQRKMNKRKDDVEKLTVQKDNDKRQNQTQKNISAHVKENEVITQNRQNVIDIQCLTKTEIEKLKVSVKQNIDKSKLPKPVAENKKFQVTITVRSVDQNLKRTGTRRNMLNNCVHT